MTGVPENDRCYFCGGTLEFEPATIPFVVKGNVIVVKNVPAHVCKQCGEAIVNSSIARDVDTLLKQIYRLHSKVSVVTFESLQAA